MSSATSITFDSISGSIAKITESREASLKTTLEGMGQSPSTSDMLKMQQEVQQWSIYTQIQSTIVKEVSDALKGVIQKAA